jgi:pyruvate,water dikinase
MWQAGRLRSQTNMNASGYVLWTEQTGASGDLGGKARALADLEQAQLPIPAWFVLTPAAFYASLTTLQRQPIEQGDLRTAATVIRGEIRLDPDVQHALSSALAELCPDGEPVAVRSSAGDEDGSLHSFAGQFDSFLFVPGSVEAVAERVASVWRSAFSQRVLSYREQNGLSAMPCPPSVLIQRMVNADRSGVAFGADPVSGRRGIAVVAAVWGLGTSLVSGESDADTYHVDRSGKIVIREIADKRTAHCAAPDSPEGVESVPVPDSEAKRPVLTDEQVRAVADLVRNAGRHSGNPRDIEWAIEAGKLYLLQSRPITSLAGLPDPDGALNLWDNSNIAESYNGITTPLTFSFARRAYTEVYRQMCRTLGVPRHVIAANDDVFRHMLGLIRGRVYYNLLNWYRLLVLLPGFTSNRGFMEQMMGVREGIPDEMAAQLASGSGAKFLDSLRMAGTFAGILANYVRLPGQIRAFHAELNAALAEPNPPLEAMRTDELAALYRSMEQRLLTHWDPPLVNDLFAMIFYGLLGKLTARWCGDTEGTLRNDLVRGKGGMISAEPAQRVRDMAAAVGSDPVLAEVLRSGSIIEVTRAIDRRPGFRALYHAYLDKFGDRCLEELKLESPTLHDDPTSLHRAIGRLAGGISPQISQIFTEKNENKEQYRAGAGEAGSARLLPSQAGPMIDPADMAIGRASSGRDATLPTDLIDPNLVGKVRVGSNADSKKSEESVVSTTEVRAADTSGEAALVDGKTNSGAQEPDDQTTTGTQGGLDMTLGHDISIPEPARTARTPRSEARTPDSVSAKVESLYDDTQLPTPETMNAPGDPGSSTLGTPQPPHNEGIASGGRSAEGLSAGSFIGPATNRASTATVPLLLRPFFNWVLKNAQHRVRDRENLRFERTRLFGRVRRIFVEMGKRFAADGLLDAPRDVFYLEVDEILGFVNGTSTCTDLRALAALRKTEFDGYRAMDAPDDRFETHGAVYGGQTYRGMSTSEPLATDSSDPSIMRGLGCCPGVVRARVRLILDPHGAEISPGSILAAERTDPGWVMLFPAAAGLLVERGSLLSHSAIVAREMGIPAIVSILGLTKRIADGELVEMDGSTGVVRRLETPSSQGNQAVARTHETTAVEDDTNSVIEPETTRVDSDRGTAHRTEATSAEGGVK